MGAGDHAQVVRRLDTDKLGKRPDVVLIGAPGVGVVDIGEPLDRRRNLGELMKLRTGQIALPGLGELVHGSSILHYFKLDKIGYQELLFLTCPC